MKKHSDIRSPDDGHVAGVSKEPVQQFGEVARTTSDKESFRGINPNPGRSQENRRNMSE